MHILLTRPLEDCKDLIFKFKTLGNKVSHLPLIEIKKKNYKILNIGDYKGIIFSSSNAVKNLVEKKINKNILCFCVGTATERIASESGFQNIFAASGNVENLKEIIRQNFDKKLGKLIYISGEIITKDLDKELISEGFSVDRIINYEALPNKNIDPKFFDQLKISMPDIIFVYSHNSAKYLLNLIKYYNLNDYWMNTNLMCISEKTSSVLNHVKCKKIFLFNPGEEEYLLYKI